MTVTAEPVRDNSSGSKDVRALLAGLISSGADPKEIIRQYLDAVKSGGVVSFQDPLYPHVHLFRRASGAIQGYVIKERVSRQEATHEVKALLHWASQNEIILGEPHYLPLVSVGSYVLSPYVGPEVYMLEHQLSDKIDSAFKARDKSALESYVIFRRALVLRQVDMLARAVIDPYIPVDDEGRVLVSNRDVIDGYKQNMQDVLRSMSSWKHAEKDDPLEKSLEFLTSFFIHSYRERYVDTYARNICFRMKADEPEALLRVTLDDILRRRDKNNDERSVPDLFTKDYVFLQPRLVQVDLHRNEKEELRGECLANILEAPGLLKCSAEGYIFGEEEIINGVARFELQLEAEREAAKGHSRRRDYLEMLQREINKTNSGRYSLSDLSKLLSVEIGCPAHYRAMSFYKALRWLGYVTQHYIPEYNRAVKEDSTNPIARERLDLYRKDKKIYLATAQQALHALMDGLYQQLSGDGHDESRKGIVLNHTKDSSHKIPYVVETGAERYSFRSGSRENPINTEPGFKHHITQLDARAATDQEKTYAGLLKLGYLYHLLTKA